MNVHIFLRLTTNISLNFTADSAIEGMNGAEYFFDDVSPEIRFLKLTF